MKNTSSYPSFMSPVVSYLPERLPFCCRPQLLTRA
jgi:hypothetical protein